MISKPVKNILKEFDDIFQKLGEDEETSNSLREFSEDVKFLNCWRVEVESEKQSIYVIGEFSTGKSEFHNFLLDLDNKKDVLLKTSTSAQTGIIQTLEHCEKNIDAYAELIIKDEKEFEKLIIPQNIHYEFKGNSYKIHLDNSERISFFKDKIIAKSDKKSTFKIENAVNQVNIKFPLKYLKHYRIIDTPGLASSISTTDNVVREYFYGKTHIFWFLDASKRTMTESLTLISEERELVKLSIARINFIANKFDMMEYEDDNNSKDEVFRRKQELTNSLKERLIDILEIKNVNPNITFTSFKKPEKVFVNSDTYQEIRSIEEFLIMNKKESNYKNITSLILTMKVIVEKIIQDVILKKKKEIDDKLVKLERYKESLDKEKEILNIQIIETVEIINKAKENIKNIKKEKNLNKHARYNKYVEIFKTEVIDSCKRICNSVRRMDLDLQKFNNKLKQINSIKDLSLKGNENVWKKYINDAELNTKKKELENYVKIKIEKFSSLTDILEKLAKKSTGVEESINIEKSKHNLKCEKENIAQKLYVISNIKEKISNIDKYLLEDIENRVNQWVPQKSNENSTLLSFLKLYSLLEEHRMIIDKGI